MVINSYLSLIIFDGFIKILNSKKTKWTSWFILDFTFKSVLLWNLFYKFHNFCRWTNANSWAHLQKSILSVTFKI